MESILETWAMQLLGKAAFLFGAIFLNLLMGALIAVKEKTFQWEKLPEFLLDGGIYIVSWLVAEIISFAPELLSLEIPSAVLTVISEYSGTAVFGLVLLKYLSSILGHLNYVRNMRFLTALGIPPKTP